MGINIIKKEIAAYDLKKYTTACEFSHGHMGFFSVISHILTGFLYCLSNHYMFLLNNDSTFGYADWTDFFEPFCCDYDIKNMQNLMEIRNYDYSWSNKLPVKSDFGFSMFDLFSCVYCYNKVTQQKIKDILNRLSFPRFDYVMHIRRGDKIKISNYKGKSSAKEADGYGIEKYFQFVKEQENGKSTSIYIMTDEFSVIEECQNHLSGQLVDLFYLVDNSQIGGYENLKMHDPEYKNQKEDILKFLAEVEIAKNGSYFIGSYSSCTSAMIALMRNHLNCYTVDSCSFHNINVLLNK